MARKRTIKVAALNVSNNAEDPEAYTQLFKASFRLKKAVRVRGDHHLLLTSAEPEGRGIVPIGGTFARFTELDLDLPWLDIESLETADDEDLKQLHIPESLKPNYVGFFYKFFPVEHKFAYEISSYTGHITPHLVEKFLDALLNTPKLIEKFGASRVNLISDTASVEALFAIPHKRKISIIIDRPNPDDLGDADRRIRDRLARQNAKRLTEILDAERGKDLKPDERTRELGEVATLNGEVIVAGKSEAGIPVRKSTKEFPDIEAEKYDPDLTTEQAAFDSAAKKLIRRRVVQRRRVR